MIPAFRLRAALSVIITQQALTFAALEAGRAGTRDALTAAARPPDKVRSDAIRGPSAKASVATVQRRRDPRARQCRRRRRWPRVRARFREGRRTAPSRRNRGGGSAAREESDQFVRVGATKGGRESQVDARHGG